MALYKRSFLLVKLFKLNEIEVEAANQQIIKAI